MEKKFRTVNGIEFEVSKKGYEPVARHGYETIYDAYDRPSESKLRIYQAWREWLNKLSYKTFTEMHISSRNSMQFTLAGSFEEEVNGKMVETYFYITKAHNYITR